MEFPKMIRTEVRRPWNILEAAEVVLPDTSSDAMEAVLLPETKVVIANEADDSVQAVADSVGGATRRRRGSEAVHQGARVPKETRQK